MDFDEFREQGGKPIDPETQRLAHDVIGAAIEVHRLIRPGQPEIVYRRALSHELTLRGIPHECEFRFRINYKGFDVGECRVDILVANKLVVELKAVELLTDVHQSQAIGYLQSLNLELALLINFNVAVLRLGIKRVINKYR